MEVDQSVERTDILDDTPPQSSKFSNFQMKDKVKTRGRPKRKTKQLTFNKTADDRKRKLEKEKTVKRANKKFKKGTESIDFIDDKNESEALESEEEEIADKEDENSCDDEEDEFSFGDDEDDSSGEVMFNNNAP